MSSVCVTFPFSDIIVLVAIINNYDFWGCIFLNIISYFPFTSISCKELGNLLSISQSPSPSSISSIACPPTVNPGNGKWFQFSLSPIQWRWASKDVEYWYLLLPALHNPILEIVGKNLIFYKLVYSYILPLLPKIVSNLRDKWGFYLNYNEVRVLTRWVKSKYLKGLSVPP